MDFVIGLVNSILNLPTRQEVFRGIQITEVLYSILLIKNFFGLRVEMTVGLVHAGYSFPEWQAVKLTFYICTLYKSGLVFGTY